MFEVVKTNELVSLINHALLSCVDEWHDINAQAQLFPPHFAMKEVKETLLLAASKRTLHALKSNPWKAHLIVQDTNSSNAM